MAHGKLTVVVASRALVLSGCANYQNQQEQTGIVIGGLLGWQTRN